MSQSFFFYDLETSGFYPRSDRVMQFGGQRTNLDLEPIGEPQNILIKMAADTVPSPDAIMVTGITPQKTLSDGITEAEFVKLFLEEIATPDTIFVGFNNIRFDDEFMRFLLYRNYADAYEWQWKDGRSRWDLLDVVRMTRALRPEGIKWPVDSEGKPGNRLELLTSINKLAHDGAHDALSDVRATIALAQLLKAKQPKLFDYLLNLRSKNELAKFVAEEKVFLYSSGKYPAEFEKTTVVMNLVPHPKIQGILVYDLRHDPTPYLTMTPEQLAEAWRWKKDETELKLPVKTMQFNRCPAVAPLKILDKDKSVEQRLQIDRATLEKHRKVLLNVQADFSEKLYKALLILDKRQQTRLLTDEISVDEQLYDGFISDPDRKLMAELRRIESSKLTDMAAKFNDKRLTHLMPLYKARNFPKSLDEKERAAWDAHVKRRLSKQLPAYVARLTELMADASLSNEKQYLLEELRLYGESLLPAGDGSFLA
jgi:exodeoxyribonuclease I